MTSSGRLGARILIVFVLAALLGVGSGQPAQSPSDRAAAWKRIYYQKPRLRFDVLWNGLSSIKPPDAIMKPGRMSVRLHLASGTTVEPTNTPRDSPAGFGGGGGTTYSRISFFPWGPNQLEEAWFEFRIDDRTYWIEVPYGFTRDPSAPLAPSEPNAGRPALAPGMTKIAPEDGVVPWTHIEYDLGLIQNGWRLLVQQSNPFDAQCLVTLYREDGSWKLDRPKTSAQIADAGGGVLTAPQVAARITDPFRRVDEYSFPRYPHDGRGWGTLTIAVDGKPTTAVIPSSLFKYTHGIAEPHHPQHIRVEPSR